MGERTQPQDDSDPQETLRRLTATLERARTLSRQAETTVGVYWTSGAVRGMSPAQLRANPALWAATGGAYNRRGYRRGWEERTDALQRFIRAPAPTTATVTEPQPRSAIAQIPTQQTRCYLPYKRPLWKQTPEPYQPMTIRTPKLPLGRGVSFGGLAAEVMGLNVRPAARDIRLKNDQPEPQRPTPATAQPSLTAKKRRDKERMKEFLRRKREEYRQLLAKEQSDSSQQYCLQRNAIPTPEPDTPAPLESPLTSETSIPPQSLTTVTLATESSEAMEVEQPVPISPTDIGNPDLGDQLSGAENVLDDPVPSLPSYPETED